MASAAYSMDVSGRSMWGSGWGDRDRRITRQDTQLSIGSSHAAMGSSGGDAGAASTAVLNGAGGVTVIAGDGMQDGGGACCGPERCTVSRAGSCMKTFFAHLFSHAGLCGLVVGYAVMGAFIFVHLEKDNELATRARVGDDRMKTLNELYNITGPIRDRMVFQERRVHRLREQMESMMEANRRCDVMRRRQEAFLGHLIEKYQGDNVPLTADLCRQYCALFEVTGEKCEALCRGERHASACATWQIDTNRHSKLTTEGCGEEGDSGGSKKRRRRDQETHFPGDDGGGNSKAREGEGEDEAVRETTTTETGFPSSYRIDVPARGVIFDRELRGEQRQLECGQIVCVVDQFRTATVCLKWTTEDDKMLRPEELKKKQFNVLWRENWTMAAGKVLKNFERTVIRKSKMEGYDGGDSDSSVQWNFSGALLYSVTVISTIGYGNIAPKTNMGKIVTLIYAMFGIPLFLMWVSQMGTFLAQLFTFIYHNICCVMCRRRRRKKHAIQMRKMEQQAAALVAGAVVQPNKIEDKSTKSITVNGKVNGEAVGKDGDAESGNGHAKTRGHDSPSNGAGPAPGEQYSKRPSLSPFHNTDSGLHSQQSLDRRTNHVVEYPGVKELLSTCAKYNLDQGVSGMDGGFPAEILDEIRQAESLRSSPSPHIPVKDKDQEGPSSPPPLPQPPPIITTDDRQQFVVNGNTPIATRRTRLGHPTVVAMAADAGPSTPTTSITPPPYSERPASPGKSRNPSLCVGADEEAGGSASIRLDDSEEKGGDDHDQATAKTAASTTRLVLQDTSTVLHERIPILPVLTFVVLYIFCGAVLFSAWEGWSMLDGGYFCFITLTTIGFGDFVPGDAVLNDGSEHGQAKLIIACVYLLMGLTVVAMMINLVQEEVVIKLRELAITLGIIKDEEDIEDEYGSQ